MGAIIIAFNFRKCRRFFGTPFIVSSDDLKPLKNLAHSFNIKANFEINDEEQLQDPIKTHDFKLEDIDNEAEEI